MTGDVAASASAYERAVTLDSTNVAALHNLGVMNHVLGRLEDAERAYDALRAGGLRALR